MYKREVNDVQNHSFAQELFLSSVLNHHRAESFYLIEMKNLVIFFCVIAIFIVTAQAQDQTECPKPGEAPPCAVSCCLSCKAAQSGNSNAEPQTEGPHLLCGCPACIINPKN